MLILNFLLYLYTPAMYIKLQLKRNKVVRERKREREREGQKRIASKRSVEEHKQGRKLPRRVEQMTEIAFRRSRCFLSRFRFLLCLSITLLFAVSFRSGRNCSGFIGLTLLPAWGMRETLFALESWQHCLHSLSPLYSTITLHRAILTYTRFMD